MNAAISEPLFFVRLLRISPSDFERLYAEIATFMQETCKELTGCIDARIFGSEDMTRILIVVQWQSQKAWSRAQWDHRLGRLIEELVKNAETIEFNLYRGDRFPEAIATETPERSRP